MPTIDMYIAIVLTLLCIVLTVAAMVYYHLYCRGVTLKDRPGESKMRKLE